MAEVATTAVAKHAVDSLLKRAAPTAGWKDLQFDADGAVERRIREVVAGWHPTVAAMQGFERSVLISAALATTFNAHSTREVQLHVALYALVIFLTDDLEIPAGALDEFMERFYTARPQMHPVLDHMVDILHGMSAFYTPVGVKAIVQATVEYMNVNAFEPYAEKIPLHPAALAYVTTRRMKNGLAEPFLMFLFDKVNFPDVTGWIQAVPDMMIYTNWANDIYSFHKEILANDVHNYILERVEVTGKDLPTVLDDLVDEAAVACDNARHILQGEKEKQAWETFVAGYAAFHRYTPRYRLKELYGDEERDQL
ncbi:terpenoid synthase [Phanerochaete sordida]|uniref:Terpenoid synthase n=1 Tax=Phanerochaete sordida TaxID=48140 RepID=A0A9P3FYL4_9APHY|nr:terpenoid synthase [Phanerochaete sordida]